MVVSEMFLLMLFMLVCFFFKPLTCQDTIYQPRPEQCLRKQGDVWWDHYDINFETKCEINPANGEECGVCGRPCFSCYRKTTIYPACWHKGMGWKFDIIKPEGSKDQDCLNMDHCSLSYLMKDKSQLEKVCGRGDGSQEARGDCKNVYGTYICECKEPYQGRDCNDIGPEGAYATGVQVLLQTKARLSHWLTVMVAVKHKGHDFKVYVNTIQFDTIIIITDPLVNDPSSTKLINYCKSKTNLGTQCDTFLKGSRYIYSIDLWFPIRRDFSVWYYEDKDTKTHHPIGYNTTLTITTTNTVSGLEKESFFRTHYDRSYIVFVEYPIYITCYENVKILNCKEVQEMVKNYDASKDIVMSVDLPKIDFNEPIPPYKLECNNNSDDTMKWKLCQIMPDGSFRYIDELNVMDDIRFVIKPYSLQHGMFRIDFIYKMVTSKGNRENFDQCFITVVEAPLIAIIEDGTGRYVDVDTVVVLDGRGSYDPNLEEGNNKVGLNFEWSCVLNVTKEACLEDYIAPKLGSRDHITLPPAVLEPGKGYIITLIVTKKGKKSASASQTILTGREKKVLSVGIKCVNCMEGNVANPTEFIYLLVKVVLRDGNVPISSLSYDWTFSTYPEYPHLVPTESFKVNETSEFLLKVEKNKLKENKTYTFRATVPGDEHLFSEIDVRIPFSSDFRCTLTPDSGTVAVTDFTLNCTIAPGLTYEVFDKLTSDPNYFTGRMLFTGFDPQDNYFKLAKQRVVVYSFNKYKMVQEWTYKIELTPFDGHLKEINEMVLNLSNFKIYPQRLLHSVSVIPGALTPGIEWSSIKLLKQLISFVHGVHLKTIQDTKLVLSSIEFILTEISKNNTKKELKLEVEEATMCAEIIFALASSLFEHVRKFDTQATLTETILHQMIQSHLNVIEIVLSLKNSQVLSKPLYLVNPNILYMVKDTTYALVDALYKLSSCLLWRQIQGDIATEMFSRESKIREWVLVQPPEVLYNLRKKNQSVPFNFSVGFYQILKDLDVLGIQVTNLSVNPFWWAGGDINTDVLLIGTCFKVKPTECKYQRTFYKSPIFLYFNISQIYSSIKPLELDTVFLNLTKDPRALDLDITVYRFDPPLRAKLLIQFEFNNSTEDYRVLFCENQRPDFEMVQEKGITINNENQSTKHLLYTRDDRDKLYYMGIFPAHNGNPGERVKFKLTIVYTVCKTWLKWKWGSQRCWVGEQETNERTLRCDCNHLSMFAGVVRVPSYMLNPAMEFLLFLTEEFNWLPLIVLIVTLVVFMILYIWSWIRDRKDLKKGIVTVLEDNFPGEVYAYLIGVYTGSRINATTKANVGIQLFGANWKSRVHILKNSSRATLKGNSDDWFLLYTPAHLGTLESLHIWHDNSGKSPDWFIENIEVYDLTDKFKYIFAFNMWLTLAVDEYPEAVAFASSIQDFYSVKRVFLSNVVTGFRDTNYWTSIFWKHARNPVKRVDRVTVVLCYIMVAILCSILLYYFNKGEAYEEDEPSYDLDKTDFIIFTITFLIASFLSCFVMFFFRKSYSHKHVNVESSLFLKPEDTSRVSSFYSSTRNEYKSQVYISKNLEKLSMVSLYESTRPRFIRLTYKNLDEKFIRLGLRSKLPSERSAYENFAAVVHTILHGSSLNPLRLPQYRSTVTVNKIYLIIAWLLFVIIVLSSTAVVVLFGHRMPQVVSMKWLTTWLCTLLFDALVLSTIKILLCSAILACLFQRVVPESNYQIKSEDGMNSNLFGNSKYLFKLAKIRSNAMYSPLDDDLKAFYRNKCIIRDQRRTFIDFLLVFLLILILVMLNAVYTVNYFTSNTHVVRMLTQGSSHKYHNFTNLNNRTLYTNFLVYNFIENLHRYLWYNQEDPLNDNDHLRRRSWTNDCTMRLLGNVRIRQLRVVLGDCPDVRYFANLSEYCSPPWSSAVEDTGMYDSRWYIRGNEPVNRKSTAWRYTNVGNSNSSEYYGVTLTLYPSGGFIEDLGFKKDDNEGALASLFPQNWLDHSTRAVFVELTLYNVNTRLFTQVILVAEQTPSGEYLVILKAKSVNTYFKFDIWNISFIAVLLFYLMRMCLLMNRRGLFAYFSKVSNVYDLFLLALGFISFSFYLVHIKLSSEYVHEYQRRGVDEFFNFFNIVSYSKMSRTILCILFVCLIVRMFIAFRFGRVYFTLFYTIYLSIPWMVWLALYFFLYLLILRRFMSFLLNLFICPHRSTVIIYRTDFSINANEELSYKVLVYFMCLSSYVVILLFIASFAYYYKVAKVYKLIDTDKLNFFVCLKETIKNICKHK